MFAKLGYVVKVLRQRGVGFFWTYFVESVWFDLRHGTRTFARVTKDEQHIDSGAQEADNGLLYVASFTSVTRKSVEIARGILGDARFAKAQFFDLGCGKGKALAVYALEFGTQQPYPAIGIEYDPDLADLARANMVKCGLGDTQVRVVTDSATQLKTYAQSDTLVIYLYNSFQGKTLHAVLAELRGVPHVLIYVDPAAREVLPEYGYRIDHEVHGRYNADTWLVASVGL